MSKAPLGQAEKARYRDVHPLTAAGWFGWTQATEKQLEGRSHRGSDKKPVFFVSKGNSLIRWFPSNQGGWSWVPCSGTSMGSYESGDVVTLAAYECGGFVAGYRELRRINGLDADTGELAGTTKGEKRSASATGTHNPILTPSESRTPPREAIANSTDTAPLSPSPHPTQTPASISTKKSPAEVEAEYHEGSRLWDPLEPLPKLALTRGLHYIDPMFAWSFRVSKRGNLRFPYERYGENGKRGLAGVESKGRTVDANGKITWDLKKYTQHAEVGFWRGGWIDSPTIIVVENPFDAIAYHIVRKTDAHFVAVRNGASAEVARYIDQMVDLGLAEDVILACDNDARGMTYHAEITTALGDTLPREKGGRKRHVPFRPDTAEGGCKDWNDLVLRWLKGPKREACIQRMQARHAQAVAAYRAAREDMAPAA